MSSVERCRSQLTGDHVFTLEFDHPHGDSELNNLRVQLHLYSHPTIAPGVRLMASLRKSISSFTTVDSAFEVHQVFRLFYDLPRLRNSVYLDLSSSEQTDLQCLLEACEISTLLYSRTPYTHIHSFFAHIGADADGDLASYYLCYDA